MLLDEPPPPDRAELRLALGMRGGVSLAVWIGGACAEIDDLRRAADEKTGFWWEVLQKSPYERVTVDVMAGASAGGLNGVLFAAAIRHGFKMRDLLAIWQNVADVEKLQRQNEPWSSLFDGDLRFLDVINKQLHDLVAEAEAAAARASQAPAPDPEPEEIRPYVDLQLSATLIEPLDAAAVSPGDEDLRRSRSTARFHFRHDPEAVPSRCDLEVPSLPRLAVAARATASFPMAFEAAVVRSTRSATFEAAPAPAPPTRASDVPTEPPDLRRLRLVDCRGFFSERRGQKDDPRAPFDQDDFVVADGGIVDNIPLGKALDAARAAPASGPTARVLVYLHPTGPSGVASRASERREDEHVDEWAERRRGPVAVATGMVASKIQSESIDGDLERLENHNRAVRLGQLLRRTVLADLVPCEPSEETPGPPPPPTAPSTLANERLRSYLVQRAGADAEATQRLLRDPLLELGEDLFPEAPEGTTTAPKPRRAIADDRWRAPMAFWSTQQRLALAEALRSEFIGRLGKQSLGEDMLVGGLGPLIRSTDLLLELAREGEKQVASRVRGAEAEAVEQTAAELAAAEQALADIGRMKPLLYRIASFLRELDRLRQLGWVCRAAHLQTADVNRWVHETLQQLRQLTYWEPHEVTALVFEMVGPSSEADAIRRFFERCATDLQTLADGESLPDREATWRGGEGDLRRQLVIALEGIAAGILIPVDRFEKLVSRAPAGAASASGADVIRRVLSEPDLAWDVRLASLEVLLIDEHLVGVPGHVEIGFARMSSAAPIIGAEHFTRLYAVSKDLDPDLTADGHHLAPDVKLAGNELASFSAFLQEEWRTNDWIWGQLDATATLVDLLLGEDRPDRDDLPLDLDEWLAIAGPVAVALAKEGAPPENERALVRRALTAARQCEILGVPRATDGETDEEAKAGALKLTDCDARKAVWKTGLETLTAPGSPELSRKVSRLGAVAAEVIGNALPDTVPRIVGPLRSVLAAVTRRFAKPTGVLDASTRRAIVAAGGKVDEPKGPGWTVVVLPVVSILAGALLAALAFGAADQSIGLAIGLAVGLLVGLLPWVLLVWIAWKLPGSSEKLAWWPHLGATCVGLLLGAGVCALVWTVLQNVG